MLSERFETNEEWKGENSGLLELQYETSVNRNEDKCDRRTS